MREDGPVAVGKASALAISAVSHYISITPRPRLGPSGVYGGPLAEIRQLFDELRAAARISSLLPQVAEEGFLHLIAT